MKNKRTHIVFRMAAALLSLMLVLLSSGLTLVRCNHTGSVSLAQLFEPEDMAADADCLSAPECMSVLELTVPTLSHVDQADFSFSDVAVALLFLSCASLFSLLFVCSERRLRLASGIHHSPPRTYLRRLRLLQI